MPENLKALILAGGRGKRLENVTDNQNKCMLNFRGRPLISYSFENAERAHVSEIVVVVGYRAEDIINEFGIKYGETKISYVIQREQKGLVHAIECAKETLAGCNFMTFLGDEILVEPRHKEMVKLFYEKGAFGVCGVTETKKFENISKTYAIIQGGDATIYRLIEKPRRPVNNIMGTGNCIFQNAIYNFIPHTPINQRRGEKELPDLIQCSIDEGCMVKAFNIGIGYININTEEDIDICQSVFAHLFEEEAE